MSSQDQSSVVRVQLPERIFAMQAAKAATRAEDLPRTQYVNNQIHAFLELYADLPLPERFARSEAYALASEAVFVFPDERLQGQSYYFRYWPTEYRNDERWTPFTLEAGARPRVAEELPEALTIGGHDLPPEQRTYIINDGMSPGHVAWNYHWAMEDGLTALIDKHRAAIDTADDDAARQFYGNVAICLQAVLDWNDKHLAELQRILAETDDPDIRANLERCIAVCQRAPAQPARTFHEAVQSFYVLWNVVMTENPYGGNGPGRLDYFLWPYLQRDLEAGATTLAEAAELIAELFIKIDEPIHEMDGFVSAIVVGGVGPDGADTTNPLTTLMLDVIEQLDLTHPSVYARVQDDSPPGYVDRCVEYLLAGANRAQVLVDEPIIRALTETGGLTFGDAALYHCGGCMEINAHGMNSDLQFSFWYNVPKTLELCITGGQDLLTGEQRLPMPHALTDFADFESFYAYVVEQIARVLNCKFRELDIYSEEMARLRPTFLLSSMVSDCFERGRDQQDGGARHSIYGGTPLGLQNAADSLTAIKRAVFDEQLVSAAELLAALEADLEGYESLRAQLLAIPKFGQDDPDADAMMNRVLQSVCEIYHGYRNRHGHAIRPIIFTFVWAPEMGAALGASPEGRKAGQPIGHGLTPQSLAMSKGLTAAMTSCLSLDTTAASGGASTMWDMDAETVDFTTLRAVFETFRRGGGMIFQGNMTDIAELEAAIERPEDHHHVIVRVGGFSARFVSLSESVQREIIERHRHRT
ncbi:MAG: pyruvate formate lyase family protein [Planctomycetota bacterium]|jgi:formate C-acetyltransferase